MKLSRRTFAQNMLGSLLTFLLVKGLDQVGALANPLKPIVRKWIIDMEHVSLQLRRREVKEVEWQSQIESLMSRVDLKDLLSAIDFDQLARAAVFPEDHESAADVEFSNSKGLPDELSFSPYFYSMKKGSAIVPHGHSNMTSMHMIIKGQAHCWQFERLADEGQFLTIKPTKDKLLETGAVTTMSEQKDNVHWFKAITEPVFMFNIGVFRLNPQEAVNGRDCIDPLGGEKLKDGLIRARRIELKDAYRIYGRS